MKLEPVNILNKEDILDLIKDLQKRGEEAARVPRLTGETNEKFFHGLQVITSTGVDDTVHLGTSKEVASISNLIRSAVNTLTARALKDRPSVTAFPSSASPEDIAASDIARKFIEYFEKSIQVDQLLDDVVKNGYKHGTAGIKVCWDPVDSTVVWTPVSIWEYLVDPTDRPEHQQWCIFLTYVDKWEARELLASAGIDEDPTPTTYKVNLSEEREGVLVLELWHKPTARVPDGLYCKVLDEHVLDAQKYPYSFGPLANPTDGKPEYLLPLVTFKVDFQRGSAYGDTPISDGIPIQRQINQVDAAVMELRQKTAYVKLVVNSETIAAQLKPANQVIVDKSVNALPIHYFPAPQVPPILFAERDHLFHRFFDVVGLNELLGGQENLKSGTSGTTIAYLNELDSMKNAGTSRSIEKMLLQAHHLTLAQVQKYQLKEVTMKITDDSGIRTEVFYAASLRGFDIDLEPRRGVERFHAQKAANAEAELQKQLIPGQQYLERKVTGQDGTSWDRSQRRLIDDHLRPILQGATPTLLDSVDPMIAIDEIMKVSDYVRKLQPNRADIQSTLTQLLDAYKAKAAELQQNIPGEKL